MFTSLGIRGNAHAPQKPLLLTLDTQNYAKESKNNSHINFGTSKESNCLEKTRATKSLRSVLSSLGNREYGINICKNTWSENLYFFHSIKGVTPAHPPTHPSLSPTTFPVFPTNTLVRPWCLTLVQDAACLKHDAWRLLHGAWCLMFGPGYSVFSFCKPVFAVPLYSCMFEVVACILY